MDTYSLVTGKLRSAVEAAVSDAVKSGEITEERLDESVTRIFRLKNVE